MHMVRDMLRLVPKGFIMFLTVIYWPCDDGMIVQVTQE